MTEEKKRILWSNESKNYLLRLIRENPIVISRNKAIWTMKKKDVAWMTIHKSFASAGMVCRLGKIKRLWKRMKDNAVQNIMTPSEQRKRGFKCIRSATDIDWQVHHLLENRADLLKSMYRSKTDKKLTSQLRLHPKMDPKKANGCLESASSSGHSGDETESAVQMSSWADMQQNPLHHSLADSEDECDDDMAEDENDALEPMTIIEEMMEPIKIEPMQEVNLDDVDDDDDNADVQPTDEYTFNQQQHSDTQMPNACKSASEVTKDDRSEGLGTLQRSLLLLDIQLKQMKRRHENARISYERKLFQKRTQLLDLQIRRAELEMRHVQRTNMHNQPEC